MSFSSTRGLMTTLLTLTLITSLISGCASPTAGSSTTNTQISATSTIANAAAPNSTAQPSGSVAPTASATPAQPRLWIDPALPASFRDALTLPAGLPTTSQREQANLWLEIAADKPVAAGKPASAAKPTMAETSAPIAQAHWIYAAAAAFPSISDAVSLAALQKAWQGNPGAEVGSQPLLMTSETRAVLEKYWGPASSSGVRVVDAKDLLDTAWKDATQVAVIPFEAIQPRWKVLRVDKQSPLSNTLDAASYPLAIPITLTQQNNAGQAVNLALPTNRDPAKLTVLAMTGVTALSRHIGERMDAKGVTYPAQDIGDWLSSADLTHISNEVSFYSDCPKPGPDRADMRFCSNPKYIELLQAVGTDIVELTGNHILDWGVQPFLDTLAMYQQRGWKTYGGGANLAESKKPLLIEHNGNKLAFIGCSPSGPEPVWATKDRAGSTPCDYPKLEAQISQLRSEGYLPIVTFQAVETDTYKPAVAQGMPDFRRMARAGAVIVSGSQSHVPQTMTFVNDGFVHYGLGNLFFDEMNPIETRQEFVDRHTFYDGKYLGVELLTALLEDYSRPRPMTTSERTDFLQKIFALSDWSGN